MSVSESSMGRGPARWNSVYDKLCDPSTYTGVYAERFRSGPGINHDAEAKYGHFVTSFQGNTNTNSDEVIRDIKQITRPYLNRDRNDPKSPSRKAADKARQALERAEQALYEQEPEDTRYYNGSANGAESPTGSAAAQVSSVDITSPPEVSLDTNTQLQLIFQYYCRFGRTGGYGEEEETLDSFNFAKLTRECPHLLDDLLTPTEVDLIFVKCKEHSGRRLDYGQFLDAMSAMAAVKFPGINDPAGAFALLLSDYVFQCPASIGIANALRTGMLHLSGQEASSQREDTFRTDDTSPPSRHTPGKADAQPAAATEYHSPPPGYSYPHQQPAGQVPYAYPFPYGYGHPGYHQGASHGVTSSKAAAVDNLTPPADIYEVITRKAIEAKLNSGQHQPTRHAEHPPPGYPYPYALPPGYTASPQALPQPVQKPSLTSSPASKAAGMYFMPSPPYGRPGTSPAKQPQTYTIPVARPSPRAASPAKESYGTPDFRPTIAGEANKPGGVYDRLSNPGSFTGVYRRAWMTDGRINHFTELGVSRLPTRFVGNTNTNTNETIHDIKHLLRPNLNTGKNFKP